MERFRRFRSGERQERACRKEKMTERAQEIPARRRSAQRWRRRSFRRSAPVRKERHPCAFPPEERGARGLSWGVLPRNRRFRHVSSAYCDGEERGRLLPQKGYGLADILSFSVMGRSTRQGLPAATIPEGMSRVTTLPAPIRQKAASPAGRRQTSVAPLRCFFL